jgi:hypothetical protein
MFDVSMMSVIDQRSKIKKQDQIRAAWRGKILPTLELDVSVYETDAMHELHGFGKLAEYPSYPRLVQPCVVLVRVDEVEKFASIDVLECQAVMCWGGERRYVRHDGSM